ncbi:ammonium transporter AmtB-like domain-containing protein [Gigaspora rosea]|uniref:Ammonium transporter n=1 Tax=Gigaspora rosea TaxID=44941 RepID=A0A397TUH9_9GLOM|nr:ammonium transporter AmtB-like domain-containing protein [Gigaspora rosea]
MANDTYYSDKFISGDVAWVLTAACFTWLMTPGIGLFYSGLARRKNALSLIMLCFLAIPIISIQWYICGYSLTFNRNAGPYIGNLQNAFFLNLDWESGPTETSQNIPEFAFAIFECMFAILAAAIIVGGAAERIRIFPTIIFIFLWSTLVYDVIASWCWSKNGWFAKLGGLDYAGGVPVHISSGASALAFCLIVGRRRENNGTIPRKVIDVVPHNIINVVIGTIFLWFGWFGFNAGSAMAANKRAIIACIVSNLSASLGGLTWMFLDYWRNGNFYAVSFCSGAIAGLITITSGSGYVSPLSSVIFGITGGAICNYAARLKFKLNFDDSMDVFAIHCVGGLVGNVLTGVFADKSIAYRSGEIISGGAIINGNFSQILIQLSAALAGMIYSFIMTIIIIFIIGTFLRCNLRLNVEGELDGTDITEHGESAYCFADAPEENFIRMNE